MRRSGSPQHWEHVRNVAANMFEQNLPTQTIATSLNVDDQTVRRWRRLFKKAGRDALRSIRHNGRPSRLSEPQKQQLAALLEKKPAELGFADHYLWTQQLIAELIKREFGVSYHHDHVGTILFKIGFSHQKPARRARERDEAKIEAWRTRAWPALLKKAAKPQAWS